MFSHIVYYKVNPENPDAAARIIEEARSMVAEIYGDTAFRAVKFSADLMKFHAARILPPERSVSGTEYDVVLNFIFRQRSVYEAYMKNPRHLQFVRFVLRGWMIKGSIMENPGEEFIQHVLFAGPRAGLVKKTRNYTISEEDVVWADESVTDACDDDSPAA